MPGSRAEVLWPVLRSCTAEFSVIVDRTASQAVHFIRRNSELQTDFVRTLEFSDRFRPLFASICPQLTRQTKSPNHFTYNSYYHDHFPNSRTELRLERHLSAVRVVLIAVGIDRLCRTDSQAAGRLQSTFSQSGDCLNLFLFVQSFDQSSVQCTRLRARQRARAVASFCRVHRSDLSTPPKLVCSLAEHSNAEKTQPIVRGAARHHSVPNSGKERDGKAFRSIENFHLPSHHHQMKRRCLVAISIANGRCRRFDRNEWMRPMPPIRSDKPSSSRTSPYSLRKTNKRKTEPRPPARDCQSPYFSLSIRSRRISVPSLLCTDSGFPRPGS